ncbi:ATP-binding protein [Arabiibacter massiliensis]|uniref:ATP-binding protein n=1 Tax=Arabiibacter massiliensis TaxID=1870985 RepID=UPI0018D70B0F|nr:ATP-binding protein [Arabiibacter massiliensis]
MDDRTMKRKMASTFEAWVVRGDSHPLLIRGARRVGKTYLVEHEGKRLFGDGFVKLDFQTNLAAIEALFDGPTDDVDRVVARIGEYKRTSLDPSRSLLFFDEVQLSEKALNALRFFSGSPWRVVATGSLLGVSTGQRKLPFPSGVRQVEMHPMDFEEYLWAMGETAMANSIRDHVRTMEPYVLHGEALEHYHRFLVVGGMPRPVRAYRETGLLSAAAEDQSEIDATYTADMTDPDNGISGIAAKRIWESLPKQLLRSSTKKFKYADVERGGRRERLLEPLEWLIAAGIVTQNDLTKDTQAPLAPYNDEEGSFFKIYVADTGLMFHKFGIDGELFLDPATKAVLSSDFRGALAENFVMQSLKANGLSTFYWMPEGSGSRGEVDFVFQNSRAEVIPVEVKSSHNVRSKSLKLIMDHGRSPYAIRLSENNFAETDLEDGRLLKSVPLYAAFCIDGSTL